MRLVLPAVVVALVASAPAAVAQKQFEGVVSMRLNGGQGRNLDMDYSVKAGKLRVDMQNPQAGPKMAMIMDAATRKMTILMPQMNAYIEQSMDGAAGDAEQRAKEITVTRTGRTETVAGHKCEIIKVKNNQTNEVTEVCGANDLGTFMMGKGPGAKSAPPAWAKEMGNVFPLRVSTAKQGVIMEATKIVAKPLDASLFTIPANYRPMNPAMTGQP